MIFYAAGMFGFFMGVPVFHFFLGIPIGWYVARRSNTFHLSPAQYHRELFLARLFGLSIMCVICIASALIALNDPYTASSLKGMLSLPFDVTRDMLIGIILVGGTALVIGEYFLIPFVAKISRTSML